MRAAATAALAIVFAFASVADASAQPYVKIVAPKTVRAPRKVRFIAQVFHATKRVAFYVDGRRRWVAHPRHRKFGHTGYLDTARIAPGRHRLRITAKLGDGRIVTAKHLLFVTGRLLKSSTNEHGKKKTTSTATSETESTSSASGVLFRGDFENGFEGWYLQSLPERISLTSSNVFQGTTAARFEVREGDVEPQTGSQRSEVSGPTFNEGQDLYFNDAIRIPGANTFSAPWQIIQQLHEVNWSGSPGLAVFLDSSNTLRLGAGDGSPTFWSSQALQRDRWYDLTYRVMLSQSSSVGFVEVWLDGVQQTLGNGQTRSYGQTIQAAQTYLKAGIYRSKYSTGTSLIEHDAIDVGTSLAAVTAG